MSKYNIDGTIVDTEIATRSWASKTDWDGRNHINRHTGSQWDDEKLYRSKKGRYYIEHTSCWAGEKPYATFVTPHEAAAWLTLNDSELPEDLIEYSEVE